MECFFLVAVRGVKSRCVCWPGRHPGSDEPPTHHDRFRAKNWTCRAVGVAVAERHHDGSRGLQERSDLRVRRGATLEKRGAFNRRSATNPFDRTDPWAQAHGYRQHLAPRDQASQSPDSPPKRSPRIPAGASRRDRCASDERVTRGEGGGGDGGMARSGG